MMDEDEYIKIGYVQKIGTRYVYNMRRFGRELRNPNLASEINQDILTRQDSDQIILDFLTVSASYNFVANLLVDLPLENLYIEGADSQLQERITKAMRSA